VYDGIPGWAAAIEPKSRDPRRSKPMTFPPAVMRKVQAYHLIARKQAVENVQWNEQVGASKEFKYTGTLVAGGEVYDHVGFRIRGGVWRYAMGKNMWKFDFPQGNRLGAHDDWGRAQPVKWSKLNLRPCISMGGYGRRGEQGMYESVGYRLFNLAGVPAPHTHWLQLRIIDEAAEAPADQYEGDFWGLYLAIENEDGRFLKAHGLADGNFYKMFAGMGDLNHQGEAQVDDRSDLKEFLIGYHRPQSEEWWRKNLDLPAYYSYRAIVECIHHYDIAEGKNYAYYRDPTKGQWKVIPWDLDLTWGDHMYGNGEEPFNARVLTRPVFRIEYQNRLREIRDLLFNEEQCGRLIEEYAAIISEPSGPAIVEADRRKWDYHPAMTSSGHAGQGKFYEASETGDFAGMVRQMKDYVRTRGAWIDATLLDDAKAPERPAAKYVGAAGFASEQLRFRAEVAKSAVAIQWRLAEVSPAGALRAVPRRPLVYEITPVWESGELKVEDGQGATIPAAAAERGKTYRVRVRVKDATGRWSHWSAPVEFVAGA
jgi:hypothetical protein